MACGVACGGLMVKASTSFQCRAYQKAASENGGEKSGQKLRVVAVGGGWAGFGTAHTLAKAGVEVTLLDATLSPGGLSIGFRSAKGKPVEAGIKGFWSLSVLDRLSALPLVKALIEYDVDEKAYMSYDFMTARQLFREGGISARLYTDFLEPFLLVTLFASPEKHSVNGRGDIELYNADVVVFAVGVKAMQEEFSMDMGSVMEVDLYHANLFIPLSDNMVIEKIMKYLIQCDSRFGNAQIIDSSVLRYKEAITLFGLDSHQYMASTETSFSNVFIAGDWLKQGPSSHGARGLSQEKAYVFGLIVANATARYLGIDFHVDIIKTEEDEPHVATTKYIVREMRKTARNLGIDYPFL